MLRPMYESVNQQSSVRRTWVMHSGRSKLHSIENTYGYHGTINALGDVYALCSDGDRVLVHDGYYRGCGLLGMFGIGGYKNNMHFIGISQNARNRCTFAFGGVHFTQHLCFENIRITQMEDSGGCINISDGGRVTFRKCNIRSNDNVLMVKARGAFRAEQCTFYNDKTLCRPSPTAFMVSPWAALLVVSCNVFKNLDRIVEICKMDDEESAQSTRLWITGNRLNNTSKYPVVELSKSRSIDPNNCTLRENVSDSQKLGKECEPNIVRFEDVWWG